ncbi:MAG: 4'-phosphopantetheinyl transferase superfamily protein [Oscillospiraceae bacterium]|nr:4'-phosphopantetheinyl transferase superfamily protein [Oscillospiraceae bacterium]
MTKLYFIEISEVIDIDEFNRLLLSVSKEKQERIMRFHFDIDKKLSLYSEVFVRTIICEMFNINNKEITFEKNEYGKPYLKGYPDFQFNLSHTRNAIAIAVSDKLVGVDIEKVKVADLKIAKRFFTKSEMDYIMQAMNDIDKRFYEVWTKKESYIKYDSKGLLMPLYSFDIFDNYISKFIKSFEKGVYIISVCSQCKNIELIQLPESDIKNMAVELL